MLAGAGHRFGGVYSVFVYLRTNSKLTTMNLYQNLKECNFALKFDSQLTVLADVYLNGVRQGVLVEIPVDVYPDWLPATQHEQLREMWDIQQAGSRAGGKTDNP